MFLLRLTSINVQHDLQRLSLIMPTTMYIFYNNLRSGKQYSQKVIIIIVGNVHVAHRFPFSCGFCLAFMLYFLQTDVCKSDQRRWISHPAYIWRVTKRQSICSFNSTCIDSLDQLLIVAWQKYGIDQQPTGTLFFLAEKYRRGAIVGPLSSKSKRRRMVLLATLVGSHMNESKVQPQVQRTIHEKCWYNSSDAQRRRSRRQLNNFFCLLINIMLVPKAPHVI